MATQSEVIKERIKKVMLSDRISQVESILASIRSDCADILSNYMSVENGEVEVALCELEDGRYRIEVYTFSDRLYETGKMIFSVD